MMSDPPVHPVGNRSLFVFVLSMSLTACWPANVTAQDAVDAGKRELSRQGFEWYAESEQKLQDLSRRDPGRAKSLDRRNVASSNRQTRNFNPNFGNGWWDFMTTSTWVLLGFLFAVIVGIIIYFAMQLEARTGTINQDHALDEEELQQRIEQLPFQLTSATRGDLISMALSAANSGEYSRATMLLFSHVLILLDRKNLIRLKKGKTNRQYINEIRRHPELISYYERVMVPFEDSFFGDHNVDKERFEECWDALDAFHQDVEKSTVPVGA